jgi:hypothetical protein
MTLQKDQPKPEESRRAKILKVVVIAVACGLLLAAIIIAIVSGVKLF